MESLSVFTMLFSDTSKASEAVRINADLVSSLTRQLGPLLSTIEQQVSEIEQQNITHTRRIAELEEENARLRERLLQYGDDGLGSPMMGESGEVPSPVVMP